MPVQDLSVVFTGTRTAEAMAAGTILLRGAALAGYYGQISMVHGPEVPGGENAALVRLSASPVQGQLDRYDIVCLIDCDGLARVAGKTHISADGLIVYDPAECSLPRAITDSPATKLRAGFREMAATIFEGRPYVAAAGFVASFCGVPFEAVDRAVEAEVADKGAYIVATCKAVVRIGYWYDSGKPSDNRTDRTMRALYRPHLAVGQALDADSDQEGINLGRRIPALVDGVATDWKPDPKGGKGR
jgi:2-oxoglutarate/2-oxoacid ferredoxin oxidoreductase subunit alpha